MLLLVVSARFGWRVRWRFGWRVGWRPGGAYGNAARRRRDTQVRACLTVVGSTPTHGRNHDPTGPTLEQGSHLRPAVFLGGPAKVKGWGALRARHPFRGLAVVGSIVSLLRYSWLFRAAMAFSFYPCEDETYYCSSAE